jgi:hypothetical protein
MKFFVLNWIGQKNPSELRFNYLKYFGDSDNPYDDLEFEYLGDLKFEYLGKFEFMFFKN